MDKISIIVPVYNVEKYIYKCLDSLAKLDYDNYDVLVINDGSPYNEQVIIDDFVKKYPKRIKSFIKENGGYGSVLNFAFNKSDADYVLICDSDDYLASDALSTLMQAKIESNADLVVGAKNLVYEGDETINYDPSFNSEMGVISDKEIAYRDSKEFEKFYYFEPSPHSKLYPLALVKDIVFPFNVSYTDNLLYFYTLTRIKSVVYCARAVSYYLINRNGNTRTDLKPKVIDAWKTVFEAIARQCPKSEEMLWYRLFDGFFSIYYKIDNINVSKEEKENKYLLLLPLLQEYRQHKDVILPKLKEYEKNKVLYQQKLNLLSNKGDLYYHLLYKKRLYGSFKTKLKAFILNNKWGQKLYAKYHFHAKYFKTRKDPKLNIYADIKVEKLLKTNDINFFGYYDKPCFAYGHSLVHRLNSSSLQFNQEADILVDGKKVSSTTTWNWQQGSMATWLDEDHIIHNFFDGNFYRSKKINIKTGKEEVYCFPIYTVAKKKQFALSLNFSRLAKLRKDYGYFNLPYTELKSDNEDGIYYLDLKTNKVSLYLSLKDIYSFETEENMAHAIHKVNHIALSPNEEKCIFLHRYFVKGKKISRLMLIDLKTKKLKVLAHNGMVSHMAWVDDDTIFGYFTRNNKSDGYAFIDLNSGLEKHINNPLLNDDGHPSVYNRRYIVTDTYPDWRCLNSLYLIDTFKNTVIKLAEFYSGKPFQNEYRCDLHPRFDLQGKSLTLDSVCDFNKRHVYHLDLSRLLED